MSLSEKFAKLKGKKTNAPVGGRNEKATKNIAATKNTRAVKNNQRRGISPAPPAKNTKKQNGKGKVVVGKGKLAKGWS